MRGRRGGVAREKLAKRGADALGRLVGRPRGRRKASLTGNRTRAAAVRAPNPNH